MQYSHDDTIGQENIHVKLELKLLNSCITYWLASCGLWGKRLCYWINNLKWQKAGSRSINFVLGSCMRAAAPDPALCNSQNCNSGYRIYYPGLLQWNTHINYIMLTTLLNAHNWKITFALSAYCMYWCSLSRKDTENSYVQGSCTPRSITYNVVVSWGSMVLWTNKELSTYSCKSTYIWTEILPPSLQISAEATD